MNDGELRCEDLVELVTDYLEGSLSRRDRRRFDRHIKLCNGCRQYLEQVRGVIGEASRLTPEALPEPLRDNLLKAFATWKSDPTR